ncbi:MAG: hypothetical protein ACOX18_07945 [Bacillota bacterium]|jgi:hypothetical protein
MIGWMKRMASRVGTAGPRPANICLWRNVGELWELSRQIADEAKRVTDWEQLEEVAEG